MIAAELYQKTLAGYKASLSKGDSVTLSRYCKMHHVNYRGLSYWMKKQSIDIPKIGLRKKATHFISKHTDQSVTGPHHMVPLLIQSPILENTSGLSRFSLKEVNITIQNGLIVSIKEINCVDLAELILSCNTR